MPTIVGILPFMSKINFVLIWVEHEKSFMTSGPGYTHLFSDQIGWMPNGLSRSSVGAHATFMV